MRMTNPKPKLYCLTVSNGQAILEEANFTTATLAEKHWKETYDKLERKAHHANLRFRGQVYKFSPMGKITLNKV